MCSSDLSIEHAESPRTEQNVVQNPFEVYITEPVTVSTPFIVKEEVEEISVSNMNNELECRAIETPIKEEAMNELTSPDHFVKSEIVKEEVLDDLAGLWIVYFVSVYGNRYVLLVCGVVLCVISSWI